MEERTSSANTSTQQESSETKTEAASQKQIVQDVSAGPSPEKAGTETRRAYGTAKTENLRDSGLWRILLPALVIIFCITLIAIPLVILVPLLVGSLSPQAPSNQAGVNLTWVWITMIIISLAAAAIVIWGFVRIFLTQAGNYHKV